MCALNADGGGYNPSMMSRDTLGFYCGRCGIWAVLAMSPGAGVTPFRVCEPCKNTASSWARFADKGHGGYVYSEHEPLLAVFPRTDGHARAGEQLAQ
jgi:hypothetical protein